MISWEELVHCLTELEKLENGFGSEIEFQYAGKYYYIISYRNYKEFSCQPDIHITNDYSTHCYADYEELGLATDFGFRLIDVWSEIEELVCKPDFDECGLDVVLDGYKAALKARKT